MQANPNPPPNPVNEARVLLDLMVRALVDDPAAVQVDTLEGKQAVVFEVRVTSEDVKRIIGRKGRTADALRELMNCMGGKAGLRYLLEIVEPEDRPRSRALAAPVR